MAQYIPVNACKNKNKTCPICKRLYPSTHFQSHLKTHLPESERVKFKCSVDKCSKEYLRSFELKLHVAKVHSSTPRKKLKCVQCCKEYYSREGLKIHVQQIHSGSPTKYGCSICESKFMSKSGRTHHIVTAHTGEKAFKCTDCSAKFSFAGDLRKHQVVHTDDRPHKCKICFKKFKRGYGLMEHVRNVHSQNTRNFSCLTCVKSFFTKAHLSKHSKIHKQGMFQYSCYFCSNRFNRLNTLEYHLRTHTQEKPFFCSNDSCQYSSTTSSSLCRHIRLCHPSTGSQSNPSKPWSCYFCSKTFSLSQHLVIHVRIHTLEEPFPCALCQKSFKSKDSLQIHIFSHTKEKPFPCPQCQKCFSANNTLQRHISTCPLRHTRNLC